MNISISLRLRYCPCVTDSLKFWERLRTARPVPSHCTPQPERAEFRSLTPRSRLEVTHMGRAADWTVAAAAGLEWAAPLNRAKKTPPRYLGGVPTMLISVGLICHESAKTTQNGPPFLSGGHRSREPACYRVYVRSA